MSDNTPYTDEEIERVRAIAERTKAMLGTPQFDLAQWQLFQRRVSDPDFILELIERATPQTLPKAEEAPKAESAPKAPGFRDQEKLEDLAINFVSDIAGVILGGGVQDTLRKHFGASRD